MKTKLTILLLLCSGYLFSQDLPDLKAYSKDIGFNTNFLFNGIFNASGSPFDVMMKKQKTSNTAMRYGISLFGNVDTNSYQREYYQYDNYSLSFSVGKEKQNRLNKRWIFYYGGDIAPYYYFNKQAYHSSDLLVNETINNEFGLRVTPFLGIRFQINERLYLATEALLRLSYGRKESSWKSFDSSGNISDESSQRFNAVRVQALPATGISFFYRF